MKIDLIERAEQMLNIQTQIGPIYVSFKTNKNGLDNLIIGI